MITDPTCFFQLNKTHRWNEAHAHRDTSRHHVLGVTKSKLPSSGGCPGHLVKPVCGLHVGLCWIRSNRRYCCARPLWTISYSRQLPIPIEKEKRRSQKKIGRGSSIGKREYTDFFLRLSDTMHSTSSNRQLVHGAPCSVTLHRTLRARQHWQALDALLLTDRPVVFPSIPAWAALRLSGCISLWSESEAEDSDDMASHWRMRFCEKE